MYKVEAIIREEKYEEVNEMLLKTNLHGMTMSEVMGCGTQKGHLEHVRGNEIEIYMRPRIKIEIVVPTQEDADNIAEIIQNTACTGNIGDGKIFIYQVDKVIRIRTGETDQDAIWPKYDNNN